MTIPERLNPTWLGMEDKPENEYVPGYVETYGASSAFYREWVRHETQRWAKVRLAFYEKHGNADMAAKMRKLIR